jgi:hypothetical protein
VNKNKRRAFEDIKANILSRITGWKAKLLSQAARTTLIKSVANATPVYTMSLFLPPKAIWLDIDSSLRKFWWGYPQEKKHCLSLLGWNKIYSPRCFGGLGLRQMEFLNKALLAKLGWSILNNADSLWIQSLMAKYLRYTDLLSVSIKPSDSWLWKGILKNRDIITRNACWVASSVSALNVWTSPWIPSLPGFKPSPNPNLTSLPHFSISDLILPGNRSWNIDLLSDLFTPLSVQAIKNIYLSPSPIPDRLVWTSSSSRLFSVKAAHESFSSLLAPSSTLLNPLDWTSLWSLKIQHRLKHFLWKVVWNILPTRSNIFKFSHTVTVDELSCPLCDGPIETLTHIFLDCPFARAVWRYCSWPINTATFANLPLHEWAKAVINPSTLLGIPINYVHDFQLTALITMDYIWMARNCLIHGGAYPDPHVCHKAIIGSIQKHSKAWADSQSSPLQWSPPPHGSFKVNFDVAVRPNFSVASAVLSSHNGWILAARTQQLPPSEASFGEASAALLAVRKLPLYSCGR